MTWGQLRFQLQTSAPGVSVDLLDEFLNSRYSQVLEANDWTGVKYHYTLMTQAAYQSGADTVTLTVGNSGVAGVGTNFTAGLVGQRFYRPGDSVIYTVTAVANTLALTLDRPYEGNGTDAAGTVYTACSYVFMQNVYPLPADVRTVVTCLDPVTGFPLTPFSKDNLDMSAGPRTQVNDPASYAVYDDTDESLGLVVHQIELFPPPLQARGIVVEYLHAATGFDGSQTASSPMPWVTDPVLLYGCRADIAMYLAGQAASPGQAAMYDRQATKYEAKFQELLKKILMEEHARRRQKTPIRMAARFNRHRMARAGRGLNNYWGPGLGGPN
jgi:hypothetical protein